MFTGDWLIILHGNNGDDASFAWQRELYLTVGTQVTSTFTSTVTWDITSTPIFTSTLPSTVLVTETVPNTQTITVASATATKVVTPNAATSWITWVKTRTKQTWTKTLTTVTKTKTATCTIPPRPSDHDPLATYTPTGVTIAAFQSDSPSVRVRSIVDRPMDASEARRRIREARVRRGMPIPDRLNERELDERAPDEATVIVTADTVANATITHTAATSTTTETVLITETASSTLPPSTVYSGKTKITITAPTPTKTRTTVSYTTITAIKTLYKTYVPHSLVSLHDTNGSQLDIHHYCHSHRISEGLHFPGWAHLTRTQVQGGLESVGFSNCNFMNPRISRASACKASELDVASRSLIVSHKNGHVKKNVLGLFQKHWRDVVQKKPELESGLVAGGWLSALQQAQARRQQF